MTRASIDMPTLEGGGAERAVFDLANGLRAEWPRHRRRGQPGMTVQVAMARGCDEEALLEWTRRRSRDVLGAPPDVAKQLLGLGRRR